MEINDCLPGRTQLRIAIALRDVVAQCHVTCDGGVHHALEHARRHQVFGNARKGCPEAIALHHSSGGAIYRTEGPSRIGNGEERLFRRPPRALRPHVRQRLPRRQDAVVSTVLGVAQRDSTRHEIDIADPKRRTAEPAVAPNLNAAAAGQQLKPVVVSSESVARSTRRTPPRTQTLRRDRCRKPRAEAMTMRLCPAVSRAGGLSRIDTPRHFPSW